MTDVLFIYPTDGAEFHMGIASMSAFLKHKGYTTALSMIQLNRPEDSERELINIIHKENPEVIAVSIMSVHWELMASTWLHKIRGMTDAPIITGGWHPSLAPEMVISHPAVDFLCIGEGEYPLFEFVDALKKEKDPTTIQNYWYKKDGQVVQNSLRPLISNMDSLPEPHYGIFDFQDLMDRGVTTMLGDWGVNKVAPFAFGRGCYFNCSYCCNYAARKIYGVSAKDFVRKKSVSIALREIEHVVKNYDVRWLEFWDEDLTLNRKWFEDFISEYPKRFDIPFIAMARPRNLLNGELKLLKDANCRVIMMGVECGDENYRKEYMHRHEKNENIIEAFHQARENGLATIATNMAGLPFETEEGVEKTLELNDILEPDFFFFFTFNPFFGTEFYDMAKEYGLLMGGPFKNYGAANGLAIKGIEPVKYAEYQKRAADMRRRFDALRSKRYPGVFDPILS